LTVPHEAIVDLPCRVKLELGEGDLRAGSRTLVNLLRAQERIELVRSRPRQDGKPIESVEVRLTQRTLFGLEEATRAVGELEAETHKLAPLVPYCTNCPANALRRPFGCVGGIPYPISRAVENYALERLAPPMGVGGALLLETLLEQKVDGSLTRDYRVNAKFEALPGPSVRLPANDFGKATLTADELFQPLLIENGKLVPWMSLNVLLWFDAIAFDDKPPQTINDVLTLTRLDPAERAERTKCLLGPPARDPKAEPFRGFLKLLHVGWSRDLDVQIDS
jgi:hypothetical protein